MVNLLNPITRFAPSPTGYLHLGHVASALYVLGLGRRLGAAVLLRIEDHDRSRTRPEYEEAIFDDLRWLGLRFDNESELQRGTPSVYRQSDHPARYIAAIDTLRQTQHVYACDCTRKQIASTSETDMELRYSGRCRERQLPLNAPGTGLRVVVPNTAVTFEDLILGVRAQTPSTQCGDLLLRDRQGQWTYQFAVAVDDAVQNVTWVIRGQDLTESTARQIMVGRWLGRATDAHFAHHPLLNDENGQKLGKRFFSEAIAKRRAAGDDPAIVLGEAASHLGLLPARTPLLATDVPALFDFLVKRFGGS